MSALRNKVQDLIDAKEIQFEAPERPNVVTAPMPQHGVNAMEEDRYVASVEEIVTPLSTVKRNPVYFRDMVKIAFYVLFPLLVVLC